MPRCIRSVGVPAEKNRKIGTKVLCAIQRRVLFAFGQTGSRPEDVNGDSVVDDADLLIVLFNFGRSC
ncbi:MAG: hypothetical protein ABDI19_02160 [Armatimonadota bacterium]